MLGGLVIQFCPHRRGQDQAITGFEQIQPLRLRQSGTAPLDPELIAAGGVEEYGAGGGIKLGYRKAGRFECHDQPLVHVVCPNF